VGTLHLIAQGAFSFIRGEMANSDSLLPDGFQLRQFHQALMQTEKYDKVN